MIRLYAWTAVPNFGDALSQVVVEWAAGSAVKWVDSGVRNKLLAVGSVLLHARSGDVIWGSGVHPLGYEDFWRNPAKARLDLTALAVRGPITRDVLLARQIACPAIYGDPAILLPLLYPGSSSRTDEALLVPHFNDYSYFATHKSASLGLRVLNPGADWREIVDAITAARLVISSSLHGIIVAEAYGVPAIWFRPNQAEGFLKFQDYYGSTQRAPFPVNDLATCLAMTAPRPPDYSEMRERLLGAFDLGLIASRCGESSTAPGEPEVPRKSAARRAAGPGLTLVATTTASALPTRYERDMRIAHSAMECLSPDAVCVDIGAHSGEWLEYFSRYCPQGQHIGFEPLPHLAPVLVNKFPSYVIHQVALANSNGSTEFQHVLNDPAWSGLRPQRYLFKPQLETIQVDIRRLDDVLAEATRVDFIKVDVEGAELEVFSGGQRTLERFQPTLYFEHARTHFSDYGSTSVPLYELLSNAGYSVLSLQSCTVLTCGEFEHLVQYADAVNYAYPAETNFIAAPAERLQQMGLCRPRAQVSLIPDDCPPTDLEFRMSWTAKRRTMVKTSIRHSSMLSAADKIEVDAGATISAGTEEKHGDHILLRDVSLDGVALPTPMYFIYSPDWNIR